MSIETLVLFGLLPYLAVTVLTALNRQTIQVESGCSNSFSTLPSVLQSYRPRNL